MPSSFEQLREIDTYAPLHVSAAREGGREAGSYSHQEVKKARAGAKAGTPGTDGDSDGGQ